MTPLLAAAGPSAYWYVSRGSGVVALLLLTAAVLAGIATSTRWSAERWPRFLVAGLHRNLTLVAIAFVAVHVVTGTGSDAPTGWLELLALAAIAAVALAVLARTAVARGSGNVRLAAVPAAVVVPLMLVGWYLDGPLRPGWAARAGMPATSVGTASTATDGEGG